ncbi:hypothetical protein ACP70R_037014 [Stipagrostis hirtigluma subsp. patula]
MVTTRSKTAPPCQRRRPDFATHPTEEELITSFLGPRVVGGGEKRGAPPSFIHDADVYAVGPGTITSEFAPARAANGDEAWYFFSAVRAKTRDGQRKARTVETGEGCWHSEAGARPVVEEPRHRLGHRQSFSFVTKVDGRRVRSGWLMVELGLDDADDTVLCKIYYSPRAHAGGRTSAAPSRAGHKRKAAAAADDDRNPAPVRQRQRALPATRSDVPAADVQEEGSTQDGGLADENPVADDDTEELWQDDSPLSWWMRNRDYFIVRFGIVDRPVEEIQKEFSDFMQALEDIGKDRSEMELPPSP